MLLHSSVTLTKLSDTSMLLLPLQLEEVLVNAFFPRIEILLFCEVGSYLKSVHSQVITAMQ